MSKNKIIHVSSGYGHNTREPFVMVEADVLDTPLQLSPDDARDLAFNILSAAEAAENDAFLFEFIKQELNQEDRVAVSILVEYRDWRNRRREQHGTG